MFFVTDWIFVLKRIWAEKQLRNHSKDERQKSFDFQNFKSEEPTDNEKYNSTFVMFSYLLCVRV